MAKKLINGQERFEYLSKQNSNFFNDPNTYQLISKFKKTVNNEDFKVKLLLLDSLSSISISNPQILKDIMPDIIVLLEDKDWRIRKSVLDILGNIGLISFGMIENHIDDILHKLEDSNPMVVCSAAYSITKITLNPQCKNKLKLMDYIIKKITNKYLLVEIIKNMSEIQPNIVKNYLDEILKFLGDDSDVIKINVLKILGNIEDIKLNKEIAYKIIKNLNGSLELRKYCAYAIWKLGKKNTEHFKDSIDYLIKNLNSKDAVLKSYSLLALGRLCYLEPKKFEGLKMDELLNNENTKKSAIYLFCNLSIVNPFAIVPFIDKIYNLLNENDNWVVKNAINIIGNMGRYNQKYITKCLGLINEKLNNYELCREAALALIKGRYIDKKVLNVVLNAVKNLNDANNMNFLKEVIEYYPPELLDGLYLEIKKLNSFNDINKKNMLDLLNLINEKKKEVIQNINVNGIKRPDIKIEGYTEPPVIVALKSECVEVELEDGKKVYILPKNCCMETPLSNELLHIVESYNKNEMEVYKLSHEIMIKSLIDDILRDKKKNTKY
ncbi:HEAT repeat domain-containing protein [Methanothermococcus okinawensis]|uniref:HEAT domain containing protein n=1 Tax=Methanothermococcus okinawensis (strain DSM 14208 / JCM 11175 / IH1) TaxID=647113 RepID=F8AMP9_METOI|nr:HEAT domain-containing protein [Methanothermococcus okinawensis]AEH06880.1 HEAT domain containing protein [Methanothermococcus okinawensis IH1]